MIILNKLDNKEYQVLEAHWNSFGELTKVFFKKMGGRFSLVRPYFEVIEKTIPIKKTLVKDMISFLETDGIGSKEKVRTMLLHFNL